MESEFAGTVALITGAASGIGAACAELLAQRGASVGIVDINSEQMNLLVEKIRRNGGKALGVTADIACEMQNRGAFDSIQSHFGAIKYSFLNAGAVQRLASLEETDVSVFDRMISVNLRETFFGIRESYERLIPGGSCVVTGSGASLLGFSEAIAYTASKHGIAGLVKACARDFASRQLRINAICPGTVLTPMIGSPLAEGVCPATDLKQPSFRGSLTPQAVAEAAILLLSNGAIALNGLVQPVDAALTAAFAPSNGSFAE